MESTIQSRVILLFGGYWDERDVSIESAQNVAAALRAAELRVTPVRWDSDGWVVLPDEEENLLVPGMGRSVVEVLGDLQSDGLGVVFNTLHGGPGEDGTLQGLLETAGVPYTGATVHGSAVSMNKSTYRCLVQTFGCEVAPGTVIHRAQYGAYRDEIIAKIAMDVGIPAVVKPVSNGSSVLLRKANDPAELDDAIEHVLASERKVLIERFIPGREISIAVLGTRVDGPPQVLPTIEIEPLTDAGLFDYEAKYVPGKAKETVPAQLEPGTSSFLNDRVAYIHRELELGAVSRTDIILGPDGPVFLETNTVPGFTEASLVPQCAAACGIDFTALCRRYIDYALSVYLARNSEAPSDVR